MGEILDGRIRLEYMLSRRWIVKDSFNERQKRVLRGQGFDAYPLQGQRSFPTFVRTESSLSTFGRVGLSTSQPLPYTVEDDHKVKVIRCENETEFKNKEMNQYCDIIGIMRQFSIARTPQENGVAERRNMTLIEATRTMLVDSKLPITFWAEAVNTSIQSNNYADLKSSHNDGFKPLNNDGKKVDEDPRKENECKNEDNKLLFDPNMPALEDVSIFNFSNNDEDDDIVADKNNMDTTIQVSPIPTTRIHKDHPLDQKDVKSAFLYGKIEEEVYVCQPLGFEDSDFLDRVYKVEKALHKGDILLVEVYVDDIIFVKQKKDGIFISQDKYVAKILKKFRFTEVKNSSTPMETQKPLLKDEKGEEVDVHMYRLMIGLLMYLTSSRSDIMFVVCACARYQVNPKTKILQDKAKKNVRLMMEKLFEMELELILLVLS
uniref:Integrase catalytic domain-containing protein n=1 Tax=Tanacetum cinerariifolium TaxID=118510 RepID=A0A6L2MKU7_TANCI|nr:hypothetical protein [Tanacetum cinerariifolium]